MFFLSSYYSYSQKVFIKPKENDTIRFRVHNKEIYRFVIFQNSVVKFKKKFKGVKYFDIYCKDYLYSKYVDTKNRTVSLFFKSKNSYSKEQLLKMYNQESYYHIRDQINEMLEKFQDRDINDYQDYQDGREIMILDRST